MTIDELRNIELHDSGIDSFKVDFDLKKIYVIVALYNETTDDEDKLEIIFEGVEHFLIPEIDMMSFDFVEIFSIAVNVVDNQKPTITFDLLLVSLSGTASPSLTFSFSFSTINSIGSIPKNKIIG